MSLADRPTRVIKSLLKRTPICHPASRPNQFDHNLALPSTTFLPTAFLSSSPLYTVQHIRHRRFAFAAKPTPHLRNMSDEAYSSFLDQANQDTGASKASTQSKSTDTSTKAVDTEVPATLQTVEQYYTSEADEPFEPVSLKWGGKNMPSESKPYTHSTRGAWVIFEMSLWTSGLTVTILQMNSANSLGSSRRSQP